MHLYALCMHARSVGSGGSRGLEASRVSLPQSNFIVKCGFGASKCNAGGYICALVSVLILL